MSETAPLYRANADTGDEQTVPFPPPAAGPSGTIYRLDLDEHASYVLIPAEGFALEYVTVDPNGAITTRSVSQVILEAWQAVINTPGSLLQLPAGWHLYRVPLAPEQEG